MICVNNGIQKSFSIALYLCKWVISMFQKIWTLVMASKLFKRGPYLGKPNQHKLIPLDPASLLRTIVKWQISKTQGKRIFFVWYQIFTFLSKVGLLIKTNLTISFSTSSSRNEFIVKCVLRWCQSISRMTLMIPNKILLIIWLFGKKQKYFFTFIVLSNGIVLKSTRNTTFFKRHFSTRNESSTGCFV